MKDAMYHEVTCLLLPRNNLHVRGLQILLQNFCMCNDANNLH